MGVDHLYQILYGKIIIILTYFLGKNTAASEGRGKTTFKEQYSSQHSTISASFKCKENCCSLSLMMLLRDDYEA